ncbi:MAG: hypothetical protein ACREVM_02170, partial [Burkholderiales bacterium]
AMIAILLGLMTLSGCKSGSSNPPPRANPPPAGDQGAIKVAKLLIEHNATDEDTGFQGFADGDPWNELAITGPNGMRIVTVTPSGGLFNFGLTELFFETSEPPNDEVPIADVLARLSAGNYSFAGTMVKGVPSTLTANLTHSIPRGAVLTGPADGATGLNPSSIVVSWQPVSQNLNGQAVNVVGYQVIVEDTATAPFPQAFSKHVFSVHLPATASSVEVPAEFMEDDTCYEYEVLAIEASGNQTLASAEFETGDGCVPPPPDNDDTPRLKVAKLLIEHNATDQDTGFQGFVDGDPWNLLTVSGPGSIEVVRATPAGGLLNFGLTELFFETSEPKNAEVPIASVLARLPEGAYTFRGVMVEGGAATTMTASLTHAIPAGPQLTSPADGAQNVNPANTVVRWQPVTTTTSGQPIAIVIYQVIVEESAAPLFPQAFSKRVFSVYLPGTATSVTVPAEFMRSGTDYEFEVLAIEASGNQTLSSAEFKTQ